MSSVEEAENELARERSPIYSRPNFGAFVSDGPTVLWSPNAFCRFRNARRSVFFVLSLLTGDANARAFADRLFIYESRSRRKRKFSTTLHRRRTTSSKRRRSFSLAPSETRRRDAAFRLPFLSRDKERRRAGTSDAFLINSRK